MGEVLLFALVVLGIATTYVILPVFWSEADQHRGSQPIECPEEKRRAFARTSAWRGAAACMGLPVRLHVLSCSLWPERSGCEQRCMAK